MSKNGLQTLKRVTMFYCDWSGSSRGVNTFVHQGPLKEFAEKNPNVEFNVFLRKGKHPYIKAEYDGGVSFTQDCKNMTVDQMEQKMTNLRNQWGRTKKTYGSGKHSSVVKSVQGEWSPYLWMKFKYNL